MFDLFRSRDKAVRILLGAILVIVALSMVTYLIPGGGMGAASGNPDNLVAEVGKDPITARHAALVIQSVARTRQVPQELMSLYVPQLIQQMVNDRALAYEARRLGLQVGDADVANAIQASLPPQLFKDGKLVSKDQYAALLADQNLTIPEFESDMARQVLVNRLRQVVVEGTIVSPAEVEQEFRRRNEKAKIEYVMLTPAKFQPEVKVTPDEMQAYYNKNRAAFRTPEKKSLGILVLDPAKIGESIQVSDTDLQKAYDDAREKYRTPERVKVRHILLKSDASNDAVVKAKAEGILKQLRGGADFGDLAKKNSEDPGSAAKGGELDWIVRQQTVKPFEDAAFSLPVNQISDLVKTQYGYHILQVEAKEQAHLKTFAEVGPELEAASRKQRAAGKMQKLADQAVAALRKDPLHPEKAADDVHAQLVSAGNIVPGDPIPQIGVSKEFEEALASLKKGEVSQPVLIPGDKVAIASITGDIPAHQASFEEAQTEIRNKLSKDDLDKLLAKRAADLLLKAQSMGGDLAKAAQSMGLEVKTSSDFDRQGAIEGVGSATLLPDAFLKPAGSLFGPISAQGAQVVAKVLSQTAPNLGTLATQSANVRDELKQKKAKERMALFEEGVRQRLIKEGKVKIHQDVINRLAATYRG
ncbi:MAG: peptidylprolyl isomerase [Acidobacteriota bacterium]|nr:peptidylprolyl isomerase [Acidobacteriota bacterium]